MYIYTHTCNGVLLSRNKERNLAFCTTCLDLEGMLRSEISQTKTDIVVTRQKQAHRHRNKEGVTRMEDLGVGDE